MNNIVANFEQILTFAKEYGLSVEKKRAILREYLQSKIISLIYQEKRSAKLFFVGGTSLRLLRGLDRFSEDLDFDSVNLPKGEIEKLLRIIVKKLKKENIDLIFYQNKKLKKTYYEFRFPNLLSELGISQNKEEKLMIKLDFEEFWQGQKQEIIFFNRYGFLANIVTKTLDQVLVEKLFAFLNRPQTQGRDIYDLVWLFSQGAKVDKDFVKRNNLPPDLLKQVKEKWQKEIGQMKRFKAKLSPFLLDEKNLEKINFFEKVIEELSNVKT